MSELNCVNCRHWRWHSGEDDWSELTPGSDWHSECRKDHWEMSGANVSAATFRENMRTARRCDDYREGVMELPTNADFGRDKQILVRRGKKWSVMTLYQYTDEDIRDADEWQRIGP